MYNQNETACTPPDPPVEPTPRPTPTVHTTQNPRKEERERGPEDKNIQPGHLRGCPPPHFVRGVEKRGLFRATRLI